MKGCTGAIIGVGIMIALILFACLFTGVLQDILSDVGARQYYDNRNAPLNPADPADAALCAIERARFPHGDPDPRYQECFR